MFVKVLNNSMTHCDGFRQIICWLIASQRLCIHHCSIAICKITSTASSMMIRSTTPREQPQKSESNNEKSDSNKEEAKARTRNKKKKGKRAKTAARLQLQRRIPLGCASVSVCRPPLLSSSQLGVCQQKHRPGKSESDFLPIRTWTNLDELMKVPWLHGDVLHHHHHLHSIVNDVSGTVRAQVLRPLDRVTSYPTVLPTQRQYKHVPQSHHLQGLPLRLRRRMRSP